MPQKQQFRRAPRAWYLDALSAFAYLLLAIVGGKGVSRTLGPVAALFTFAFFAGLGWFFARSAWRGLLEGRDSRD